MSDQQPTSQRELLTLLQQAISLKASDLHIVGGVPPMVRVDGALRPLEGEALTTDRCSAIVGGFIGKDLQERAVTSREELDFAFGYQEYRIRANIYLQKGVLSASLRVLPGRVPTMEELGIPPIVSEMIGHNQGLLLVCGPTGSGKSTTLGSIVNQIALTRRAHIVTIEDPIEFFFDQHKSVISQREVGTDTPSFHSALRAVLREDPDVVLVGELRDLETVSAALEVAETGHLVLATLHTNSAAQTANRIVDIFPPHQQAQVRTQLADSLLGIMSQRLLPTVKGGRVMAAEVLVATQAVRSLIREGKTHQIPNVMQTAAADGMIPLDKSLADLVGKGEVSIEDALAWSLDPKSLKTLIY